jgi:hypothetical protein
VQGIYMTIWRRILQILGLNPSSEDGDDALWLSPPQNADNGNSSRRRAHRIMALTMVCLLFATGAGTLALASFIALLPKPLHIFGIAALIGGSALFVGALVGFLFGIPRTLQGEATDKTKRTYQVNTNLEQISDWLTKIIVGLGLVNLRAVPGLLMEMNDYFAPSLGGGRSGEVVAGGTVVYFGVLGFFWGYLGTRLYLAGAIPWADDAGNVPAALDAARGAVDRASSQDPLQPPSSGGPTSAPTLPAVVKRLMQLTDATRPDPAQLAPDDSRTIALSYYLNGRFADAIPFFDAVNKDPGADPQFTFQHAIALGESKNYGRAVALLERLAREGKGVPQVYKLVGYYMLWLPDRLADAIKYSEEFLKQTGSDSGTYLNIASAHSDIYEQLKKTDPQGVQTQAHLKATIDNLKLAISLDPGWRQRAIELRRQGENFSALTNEEFEQAIGTAPDQKIK